MVVSGQEESEGDSESEEEEVKLNEGVEVDQLRRIKQPVSDFFVSHQVTIQVSQVLFLVKVVLMTRQ